MSANEHSKQLAWHDRWKQPSMSDLLSHMNADHRKVFNEIVKQVEALGEIKTSIVWYGVAWKWTIQCHWTGGTTNEPICFLIPKEEAPEICIPLATDHITALPMRRLNRTIRDGIRVAKCALEVHWATWSPSNQTDVAHLLDLLKRKHKFLTGASAATKDSDESEAEAEAKPAKATKTKSKSKASSSKAQSTRKSTTKKRTSKKSSTKKSTKKKTTKKKTTATKKSKASTKRTTKAKPSASTSRKSKTTKKTTRKATTKRKSTKS